MNDQIDQLMKMKAKVDKDKSLILHEIDDIRAATDEVNRSNASIEKTVKSTPRCKLLHIFETLPMMRTVVRDPKP